MAQVIDQKELRWQQSVRISQDVIEECRVQLMLKFKFLDLALWRMPLEPTNVNARYPMATDGKSVYFDPESVIIRYEQSFEEEVRDYLHMILHCIFRHPFDKANRRNDAWWMACDVMAENAAMEMCGGRFPSEEDGERKLIIAELKRHVGELTPVKLYNFFVNCLTTPYGSSYMGYDQSKLNTILALFERDNHEAWPSYVKEEQQEQPGDIEEIGEQDDDADESADPDNSDLRADGEMDAAEGDSKMSENDSGDSDEGQAQGGGDDDASSSAEGEASLSEDGENEGTPEQDADERKREESSEEKEWEDVAKQIEMDLETFSKEWSDEAGALIASLEVANRKKYDYSDFLRRFTVISEEMKVNMDEFDYIYYTYGIELYDNTPLIEPLEYKNTDRVRDFVIVIDTSESVKGDLVRRFLEHTFEILKESEDYTYEVNIHIIQCDAKVQADTKITDLRQVDDIMKNFHIRGFGGTDFRPAFDYVEQLRKRGELAEMKGLIYFTDGLGSYPEKSPDFDAAFVFMDNGEPHLPSVPPWAMKIVIDEEGINNFKSSVK